MYGKQISIAITIALLTVLGMSGPLYASNCEPRNRLDGVVRDPNGESSVLRIINQDANEAAVTLTFYTNDTPSEMAGSTYFSIPALYNQVIDLATDISNLWRNSFEGYVEISSDSCVTAELVEDYVATEGGGISGFVTDTAGEPIENVPVSAYIEVEGNWTAVSDVRTDEDGFYAIANLPPNSFRVQFGDSNFEFSTNYAIEYYDNQFAIEDAANISVTSNITTTGIDAQLEILPTISGLVTDEDGNPLSGILIDFYRLDETGATPSWDFIGNWIEVYTNDDGAFEFQGLAAGTYRVGYEDHVSNQPLYKTVFFGNVSDFDSATDIIVGVGQQRTDINLVLDAGNRIMGTVTNSEGVPLPEIWITAYVQELGVWTAQDFVSTDVSGNYRYPIDDLPAGPIRLEFDAVGSANYTEYVSEYYDNVATIESATDIDVSSGENISGIDVQLSRLSDDTSIIITGSVTSESGAPLPNIVVEVYAEESLQGGDPFWESISRSATDASGAYVFALSEFVAKGRNTFRICFGDYEDTTYIRYCHGNRLNGDPYFAEDIVVDNSQSSAAIVAQMQKYGVIRGKVTDEAGNPVAASLDVYLYDEAAADWSLVDFEAIPIETNENGDYRIPPLHPGRYRIQYHSGTTADMPIFYGGSQTLADATDVDLASGQVRSGIDVTVGSRDRQSYLPMIMR